MTITPDADATVRLDAPAKNQGRAHRLSVRGGSRARRSILRFAVRLPRHTAVLSATLSLYALTRGFTSATEVRGVVGRGWCERTKTKVRRGHGRRARVRRRRLCRGATRRRQPVVRARPAASARGWAARTRVTFDVTSLRRRTGRLSLAIVTSGSRDAQVRESPRAAPRGVRGSSSSPAHAPRRRDRNRLRLPRRRRPRMSSRRPATTRTARGSRRVRPPTPPAFATSSPRRTRRSTLGSATSSIRASRPSAAGSTCCIRGGRRCGAGSARPPDRTTT